jgi:plastocyanin/mono/diheme cytochrome c family protein
MSSIFLALAALVAVGSGCGSEQPDLANGKRLYTGDVTKEFQAKNPDYQPCSSCHALGRANVTTGSGPDLDSAFAQARADGMTKATVQGVVHDQINAPRVNSQMPADLVTGDDARDVAAYVAEVAAQPGDDTGELANIPAIKDIGPISAKNGVLEIAAVETGVTRFVTESANAPAGAVEFVMPNPSSTPHNIALKGGPTGNVVGKGGESRFEADLKAGKYTFYCSVPGHESGGMVGTLTVK